MQTIKILSKILDGSAPEGQKNHVSLYEANNIEYRWYKMNKSEFDSFFETHEGVFCVSPADVYFKRKQDGGMADDISFCHLYFYDFAQEKYLQLILFDVDVFIMNSAGQTIDRIYS